jgi:hypothetical protein
MTAKQRSVQEMLDKLDSLCTVFEQDELPPDMEFEKEHAMVHECLLQLHEHKVKIRLKWRFLEEKLRLHKLCHAYVAVFEGDPKIDRDCGFDNINGNATAYVNKQVLRKEQLVETQVMDSNDDLFSKEAHIGKDNMSNHGPLLNMNDIDIEFVFWKSIKQIMDHIGEPRTWINCRPGDIP